MHARSGQEPRRDRDVARGGLVFPGSAGGNRRIQPALAHCDGGSRGSSSPQPVAVPSVLEFEAPLLAGGTMQGASLAGRDVAFWFWAPW